MPRYNFDREADTYEDFYIGSPGHEIDLLEKKLVGKFLKQIPREDILEIGCGTGHWTAFFSEKGFHIHGLDISARMLEKARDKDIPNTKFVPGRAEELPFDDQSFTNVVCITALEFVDDRAKALEEMDRVLKPGGFLMIGALNENSFLGKHKKDFEVFRNAHFFTESSLSKYLSRFGVPEIAGCVVQDNKGNILDINPKTVSEQVQKKTGAFLLGFVKKNK